MDASIADMVRGVPAVPVGAGEPRPGVPGHADLMVVSATPLDALRREWGEHGLSPTTWT